MKIMREFTGRMSIDQADPGYCNWIECNNSAVGHIRVYLDDVEQRHCDMADTIAGEVRRCKVNSDGNIYADGDVVATEIVKGAVRIVLEIDDGRNIISMGVSR
jgi:hypothetical protein